MKVAIEETERRRATQEAHNLKHGVTPKTVQRAIMEMASYEEKAKATHGVGGLINKLDQIKISDRMQLLSMISDLRKQMKEAASNMEYEKAAVLRDKARELEQIQLGIG